MTEDRTPTGQPTTANPQEEDKHRQPGTGADKPATPAQPAQPAETDKRDV